MKKTLIFLFVFAFYSCNRQQVPENVIPFDDMVDIIVDIHITDGIVTTSKIRRQLIANDSTNFYNAIFDNYSYTRKDFDTSLYYYSKNINQYDLIYDEVLNRLSKIESELKENKKLQDTKKE